MSARSRAKQRGWGEDERAQYRETRRRKKFRGKTSRVRYSRPIEEPISPEVDIIE